MKKHSANIAFILGFGLLSFVFFVVLLTALAFLLGGSVHIVWSIMALLASGGLVYYLFTKNAVPKPTVWLAAFIALLVGSVGFASVTMDPSWDGNSYHKTAIGQLADGWNPVRQDVNTFNASAENPFKLIGKEGLDRSKDRLWLDHYPKGSWIFAANMYEVTGNIESGKALTPIVTLALLLVAFGFLYQKVGRNRALVLSALLALSPIAVAQFNSYYNDGVMGSLLILLLLACTMLLDKKAKIPMRQVLLYGTIIMAAVLVLNLKFTGLAYAGLIMACYWIYLLVIRNWQLAIRFTCAGVAVLVLGLLVVGASSYAKNTMTQGSPLYPLVGKGSVDFMAIEELAGYENMTNLHRFIKSNLSPTVQMNHQASLEQGPPSPKVPFTATIDEIRTLKDVDVRQGGYGVWFGGILLLSVAAGLYLLIRFGRQYKKYLALFLLPLATIGVCIVLVDATWWARYMPQLIVFPVIITVALYMLRHSVLANIMVFALLFNTTLIALVGLDTQVKFQQTAKQNIAAHLPCDGKTPARIYSSMRLDGSLYNLRDICRTIEVLTPEQLADIEKQDTAELFNGIYVVKNKQ